MATLTITLATYGLASGKIPVTKSALADSQRVVSLYVDGEQRIIPTDASTVGELLARYGIALEKGDIVEPSLSTAIPPGSFNINVYRSHPVVIQDGEELIRGQSAYYNPNLILEQLQIQVFPEDIISVAAVTDFMEAGAVGQQISIQRAKVFTLEADGISRTIRTQKATIAEALAELNVALEGEDEISHTLDTAITPGMKVTINRYNEAIVTVEEVIKRTQQVVRDPDLEVPSTVVRQEGHDGKKVTTYKIRYEDGKPVSKGIISTEIAVQPVARIIAKGALITANTWYKLRWCESGNFYQNKNNPYYRGAYQFSYSTWGNYGGYYDPADAPPSVQDEKARLLQAARGWRPWPTCAAGW